MSAVREYLLTLIAAALLTEIVVILLPKGKMQYAGRLLGTLILITTALTPVLRIDSNQIIGYFTDFRPQMNDIQTNAAEQNYEIMSELIKDSCETYILEKANQIGVDAAVQITIRKEGEYPYPDAVTISASITEQDKMYLEQIIVCDLGIPQDKQEWSDNG